MANPKTYTIKPGKNHGGKEFQSSFHFIGKIKNKKEKDLTTDSWEDVPFFRLEEEGKKKVLEFVIETDRGNDLRLKLTGKEMPFAYPYSSKHRKSVKVDWKDRFDKTTFPDDTYHLIDPEWDKADKFNESLVTGDWYEVKGKYSIYEFANDEGETIKGFTRTVSNLNKIVDGKVMIDGELKPVRVDNKELIYVADFDSPDFIEVNNFNMQIGIRSTYQDGATGNVKVNATYLDYGKQRSEPKDVELDVYQELVTEEGKKSLADAFASLNQYDFIEVKGKDNNRATYAWVDVPEVIASDDPFADVEDTQRVTRQEKVINGAKKGLEITGYVGSSLMRDLLTEEEFKKSVAATTDSPFENKDSNKFTSDDPFAKVSSNDDPFA
jgi:hypothetical protein